MLAESDVIRVRLLRQCVVIEVSALAHQHIVSFLAKVVSRQLS